jgi:hypothetical protein
MTKNPYLFRTIIKTIAVVAVLLTISIDATSQIYSDKIFKKEIKTVQIYRLGSELSDPTILLGLEQLKLSFDELSNEAKTYHYTFIHCDADWQESEIYQAEYLKGFPTNQIYDYTFSFNTSYEYVHYSVIFPNEDVHLLKSGNYIIKVFEDLNENNPILIRRFRVSEQIVNIIPTVKFPINSALRNSMQQLDVRIEHKNLDIVNPAKEIKMVVQQNGRQDNIATHIPNVFVRQNEIAYEYQKELLFEGGNEYRWLDIRSIRFLSEQVKSTDMFYPYYHTDLFTDKVRNKTPYFYKQDSNGKYVVSVREYDNPDIDADYTFVHFSLPMPTPMLDGDIYVLGALTNWETQPSNLMRYNFDTMQYELTLLLKQGFYNYQYLFVPKNETKGSLEFIEGSYSIAENDYQIFVYFRGPSDYYDRLVGTQIVNSLKPQTL